MPVVVNHRLTGARMVQLCERHSGGVHPLTAAAFLERLVTPAVQTT
jgi:hypothetical protein